MQSCDDSCAAVVAGPASPPSSSGIVPSSSYEVLSQAIAHQDHSSTGGIHPYNATLSHAANLPGTIARALSDAGIGPDGRDIDAIAVTQGPGMASSLGVGLTAAKTLAAAWNKDIIYVHHMAAHALTPLLTESEPPQFPFLTLLVSGGHTMLVLAHSPTQYRLLASTSDDSIGDAFDKVARALQIPWGGKTGITNPGAALEKFASEDDAETSNDTIPPFPVPAAGSMTFSYSGVKSSVLRYIETYLSDPTSTAPSHRRAVARAFQSAAVRQIEDRVALAFGLRQRRKGDEGVPIGTEGLQIRDLVCSGGVASNSYLRTRLAHLLLHPSESSHEGAAGTQATSRRLHFPPLALCTDNAVMIAFAAHLTWDRRTRAFDRHARPRWSLEDL
ncbi:Mitochondrial tRNAs modification protein [Tilletia horrida]|nr:Mitochondrial tRNAs modification protein [Tilletia horrida]